MKLFRIIVCLTLFCIVFAEANIEAAAKDEWIKVQSKNFQLVGNASENELRGAAAKLEQFRVIFEQLFPQMNFNSPIPTRIMVFKDEESFKPFKSADWTAGLFQAGEDLNYIAFSIKGEQEDTFRTIFHEYTHFMIDNTLGRSNIPPWLNEGIAGFYERLTVENDQKITLGNLNGKHLELLQKNNLIPFDTFFAVDYYTLHKQTKPGAQLFYAQSWALIHYFLQGNNGARKPQFDKFSELLLQGIKPKEAFEQAFQTGYAAMQIELRKYLEQQKFSVSVTNLKEKLIFDNQMQTFPLAEAEAKAFEGDLLYHTNHLDEAEKYLRESLASDANSSFANTALGLVNLRRKKFYEAKILLAKAIQADPKNYLAYYSYAFAVSREGITEYGFASDYKPSDAEIMRENLRKAIDLNPNFAESYNLFAFVNVVRNEEIDESLEMIEKAQKIAPGNQWYALRQSELLMRREDFTNARKLALKVMQTASDDQLKIYAENTVRTINTLESQLNDIKNLTKREQDDTITDKPLSDEEIARRREKALLESLNATLRIVRRGEKRLLGFVTKIDCQPNQIIFSIKSGNEVLQLKSQTLETLKLISFAADSIDTEFGCGEAQKEKLSVITFRPNPESKSNNAGEIVSVEFVPKNFRFLINNQ